ncbi:glycoside hydrolase family 3 N-terminal domain-containing protein [Thermomonospora amylolytica]|uniref:glycoside hydrolase family 3 N-terminal domain-containing protein n=1 Tax=Thermomonospora amylolytica TaxID=1411117 RepID=UPI001F34BF07|nr:glycoside hydrolase family 3 N-terminal domain-containing protein [Thermomonospora amylolytica]
MLGRSGRRAVALGAPVLATAVLATVVSAVPSSAVVPGRAAAQVHARTAAPPYQDPSLPVRDRVEDLLARMSLDDKVGQMTQAERGALDPVSDLATYRIGSVLSGGGSAPSPNNARSWADMYDSFQRVALSTPLGIPMIYGVDAVHGHNNVHGATIFPHNIGLGAARDPELVRRIGRATAEEMSGTGVDWNFAPCVCVARNDRWGRTYESFGELPELPGAMTTLVTGLQGESLNASGSVLATAKHYVGDGGTTGGVDQGDTRLSEAELRAVHLPPFRAAIERGVGSVMISFSSWNGAKLHGHRYLITDVLKGELGFSGFVVSDWAGIDQLDGAPGFTAEEVRTAVNAGIDMVMVPNDYRRFIGLLRSEVQAGRIPMARVDDANRRILTKKFELGLFERPLTDRNYTGTVGSAEHRALAREAVRKSQVLLKNDGGVLPLAKDARIFVAGKSADDIGNQSGGWTISWQGDSGPITPGTTILQAIRNTVTDPANVTYSRSGSGINGDYDVAVAVVGETPYAEGEGDRPGSLGLDAEDLDTLARLRSAGVPVVVVLVSGRPLDIGAHLPDWRALLAAWLPGTEGQGVADVLFGDHRPTGKLPMTWMQSASQQPINDGDGKTPLFPYGYGLTYPDRPTDPTPTPTPTTPPPGPAGCTAEYRVIGSWSGGFQAEVTVRNAGGSPLNGWTARWNWNQGQRIASLWNGVLAQNAPDVIVRNASWNGALAPGTSATFGFTATGASTPPSVTCTAP